MCHFTTFNHAIGFVFGHDYLKLLVEVGKWIKYMGKQFLPKTDFPFKSYDKKLVFLQRMDSFFPYWVQGEKLFFSNPCGQLLQNFLHMFS
jgi:hypothetical protein